MIDRVLTKQHVRELAQEATEEENKYIQTIVIVTLLDIFCFFCQFICLLPESIQRVHTQKLNNSLTTNRKNRFFLGVHHQALFYCFFSVEC
jgi:hypothetical protein